MEYADLEHYIRDVPHFDVIGTGMREDRPMNVSNRKSIGVSYDLGFLTRDLDSVLAQLVHDLPLGSSYLDGIQFRWSSDEQEGLTLPRASYMVRIGDKITTSAVRNILYFPGDDPHFPDSSHEKQEPIYRQFDLVLFPNIDLGELSVREVLVRGDNVIPRKFLPQDYLRAKAQAN